MRLSKNIFSIAFVLVLLFVAKCTGGSDNAKKDTPAKIGTAVKAKV